MPNWTPGPWSTGTEYSREITDVTARVPPGVACTGSQTIAIMRTDIEAANLDAKRAEVTANARLVAAAPDLYEALETMLEYLRVVASRSDGSVHISFLDETMAPFLLARTCLAKARGEQPK